jgi:hypothetical protein
LASKATDTLADLAERGENERAEPITARMMVARIILEYCRRCIAADERPGECCCKGSFEVTIGCNIGDTATVVMTGVCKIFQTQPSIVSFP